MGFRTRLLPPRHWLGHAQKLKLFINVWEDLPPPSSTWQKPKLFSVPLSWVIRMLYQLGFQRKYWENLQPVQNSAAHLRTGSRKYQHIISVLWFFVS